MKKNNGCDMHSTNEDNRSYRCGEPTVGSYHVVLLVNERRNPHVFRFCEHHMSVMKKRKEKSGNAFDLRMDA